MLNSTASVGAVTLAGAIDLSPIAAEAVAAALREAARHAAAMLDAYDPVHALGAAVHASAFDAWVRRSHRRKHLERADVRVWITPGLVYVRGPRACVAVVAEQALRTALQLVEFAAEARELHEQLRPFDRPLR